MTVSEDSYSYSDQAAGMIRFGKGPYQVMAPEVASGILTEFAETMGQLFGRLYLKHLGIDTSRKPGRPSGS